MRGLLAAPVVHRAPMSEPETPPEPVKQIDDAPPKSELFALGCGCLLIVLIFVAAVYAGFQRT